MKHAVIVAHPDPGSFNLGVANAYCEAARARGHEALLRDLYRLNFDPVLKAGEIPQPDFEPGADVVAERALIGEAAVFVLVYPLWFYAPPAMLKGYVDRVFNMGFGFGESRGGGNSPLLTGRALVTITTSGAPLAWVKQEGAWEAIRNLFDAHFAAVCGMRVLEHLHFGGVTRGWRPDAAAAELAKVRQLVERLF
jgi:NAD(P)H dehydrogenase (quinone)